MKLIYLAGGSVAKVSDEDHEMLSKFSWHVARGYATRSVGDAKIRMHRDLLNPPEGMEVDHIDGDRMNNCRENLRLCRHHQNMRNLPPRHWLKYKGARPNGNGFMARIRWSGGNCFHLGTFTTEEAAARAYDKKAHELDPEFSRLNFDDGIWTEAMLAPYRIAPQKSDSGVPGVYCAKKGFYAQVRVNGVSERLGTFKTKEEAVEARTQFLTMKDSTNA